MAKLNKDGYISLIQDNIERNLHHQDYERTVSLAKLYRQMVTGEGIGELIESFRPREDPELLLQRIAITHAITPAVSERVMSHFFHIGRLDSVTKRIAFSSETSDVDKRVAEITDRLDSYYGDDDLDEYLALRLVELNFLDPNTFVITDFENFDSTIEKARPYPREIASENAVNYSILNNRIDWLISRYEVSVKRVGTEPSEFKGYQYTLFTDSLTFRYTRVDQFGPEIEAERRFTTKGKYNYVLDVFDPVTGEFPGFRVGYKRDLVTNGRTLVSPMNGAMCHFQDCVQTVSQYDLSKFLHVFPQKIQYVDDCPGPDGDPGTCRNGTLGDGSTCGKCGGTGLEKLHTSAQDAILLKKPRNAEDYIDLEKLLIYKAPPTEVLTFQREEVERLEVKILTTIFNTENVVQTTVSKTATEVELSADSRFNALFPFSKCVSRCWIKSVRLVAIYLDNAKGLILLHKFPNDFKLRTLGELLSTLERANKASAPAPMRQRIALEIVEKQLVDDELGLARYKTQVAFTPFQGKSDEMVLYIISNKKCRQEDEILWTHSDTIFDELEYNNPAFFKMARKEQEKIVMAAVEVIAKGLPSVGAIDFRDAVPQDETEAEDTPVSGVAENVLRRTVGGGELVIRVQESVSKGFTTYEAGVAMLVLMFSFNDEEARKLLGDPIDLKEKTEDATVVV